MHFKFPTEEPEWTSDMAASLRQFLNTPVGQIFLQRLFWARPTQPVLPALQGVALDPILRVAYAEQLGGYERALSEMLALTVSPK